MSFFDNDVISIHEQTDTTSTSYKKQDNNSDSAIATNVNADIITSEDQVDEQGNQFCTIHFDYDEAPTLSEKKAKKYRVNDGTNNYQVYAVRKIDLHNSWRMLATRMVNQ